MNTFTGEVATFESEAQFHEATKGCAQVWKPIDLANLTVATRKLLDETGRAKISRNSPCPCGSRKRFKRCCMQKAEKVAADVLFDAFARSAEQPITHESVQDGDAGTDRWRKDRRVRRYLLAKRPLASDTQRIINYRTEACVAFNIASEAGEPADLLAFLRSEHDWAMSLLPSSVVESLRSEE